MEEQWAASRQSARANPFPRPPADHMSRDSLARERCPGKPSALIDVLVDGRSGPAAPRLTALA